MVTLLRDDAILTMPPSPTWIFGAENIAVFYQQLLGPAASILDIEPTRANGGPAFLMTKPVPALQVLELSGDRVRAIHTFTAPEILARFTR